MIDQLLSALLVCASIIQTGDVGKATYYRQGLMERVAGYRGIDVAGASGFSTHPDCGNIGRTMMVSVRDPRSGVWSGWERKRIVDCSQAVDYDRHVASGLVELSYEDARKYGYLSEGRSVIRYYLEWEREEEE